MLDTLRLGLSAGAGWDVVRHLEHVQVAGGARITADGHAVAFEASNGEATSSMSPRSRRRSDSPSLQTLVQGELFCLAAQDGTERDRLPLLIWRLRKAQQAPTPRLLTRALIACGQGSHDGWRNVFALLELARLERIRLSEQAFVAAVEAYEPLPQHAGSTHGSDSGEMGKTSTQLRELAALLNVSNIAPDVEERLEILCSTSAAAGAHVQQLLSALRPRSAIHDVPLAVRKSVAGKHRGRVAGNTQRGEGAAAYRAPQESVPSATVSLTAANPTPNLSSNRQARVSKELCELIGLMAKREQVGGSKRPGSPHAAR